MWSTLEAGTHPGTPFMFKINKIVSACDVPLDDGLFALLSDLLHWMFWSDATQPSGDDFDQLSDGERLSVSGQHRAKSE